MDIFQEDKYESNINDGKIDYAKFYIDDFINDFKKELSSEIFETDEEAKEFYIQTYGQPEEKSSSTGFVLSNSLKKICPKELTKEQKIKLLLLLKETNCEAKVFMSYNDVSSMKKH